MRGALGFTVPHVVAAGGFVPTDITGLKWWIDPSDTGTITEASGLVSQIDDKSSSALHPIQTTGSLQPSTGVETIGGLNALGFPVDEWMEPASNPMAGSSAGHAFYILRLNDDAAARNAVLFQWGSSGSADHESFVDGNIYYGWGSTVRHTVGNPTPSLTTERLIEIRTASSAWSYWIDGVSIFSTGTNTVGWGGTQHRFGGGSVGVIGEVGEVLCYDSVLTGADLTNVRTYLSDKWSVA
jgi:hypothetical protein